MKPQSLLSLTLLAWGCVPIPPALVPQNLVPARSAAPVPAAPGSRPALHAALEAIRGDLRAGELIAARRRAARVLAFVRIEAGDSRGDLLMEIVRLERIASAFLAPPAAAPSR